MNASNEAATIEQAKQAKQAKQAEKPASLPKTPEKSGGVKMAGIEIDIALMAKAMSDTKAIAGDLQALAEKSGLGRSIETISGGKVKVPTPAVMSDLVTLNLLGSDKAKAKAKVDRVKALLSVLRGLEALGVIKR